MGLVGLLTTDYNDLLVQVTELIDNNNDGVFWLWAYQKMTEVWSYVYSFW